MNNLNTKNSSQPTRERSSAVAITAKTKEIIAKDIGHMGFIDDEKKKEEFTRYLENKFGGKINNEESDYIELKVPSFSGNQVTSQISFSENSRLVNLGIKYQEIKKEITTINFKDLISLYDEQSIQDFEIQELMRFDFESIGQSKEKLNELIDKISVIVNSNSDSHEESHRKSQILVFLCNKMNVSF